MNNTTDLFQSRKKYRMTRTKRKRRMKEEEEEKKKNEIVRLSEEFIIIDAPVISCIRFDFFQ